MQEQFIKELSGHSGCDINLYNSEKGLYVRKKSKDISYNRRLMKQCIKQNKFISKKVYAPKVFKYYKENGLFYFDMQFIKSKTLAQYCKSISTPEIKNLISVLFENLYYKDAVNNPLAKKIFLNKILSLKKDLVGFEQLTTSFQILENYSWENIPESPCHGDLTFENILVTLDNKIYLIDFLDSFYNSWLFDIAKLLQDLELKWSFRYEKENTNRDIHLLIAKEVLIEKIKEIDNSNTILTSIYHILLLNIVRIYPYATDNFTLNFLDESINKIIKFIGEKNEYTNCTCCR